jgi:hypothetical protein
MLVSYDLEERVRIRMEERLQEAEHARLLAAVPAGPGLGARARAALRWLWPGTGGRCIGENCGG